MSRIADHDQRFEAAGEWYLRLADGEASVRDRRLFRAWLEADPGNAAAFDDVVRAWQAFDDTAGRPALVAMRGEALSRLRGPAPSPGAVTSQGRRGVAIGMAACILLMAIGAIGWWQLKPRAYQTGLGERQLVRLGDGSQLSLDADTRVDVRYTHDRRDLVLAQGRARFRVARDPLKPFTVAAGDRIVVATGTEFSVELLQGEVRVVLYEGSVEVLPRGGGEPTPPGVGAVLHGRSPADEPRLRPGQELVARLDSRGASIHGVDAPRSRAWEAGQLAFHDEPLAQAVQRMNRHPGPRLAVGDERSGALRISGTFAAGDGAAFVEGVTGVFPVRASDQGGVIVLTRIPAGDPATLE